MSLLDTGINNVRNVGRYIIGHGEINRLEEILSRRRGIKGGRVVFLIDEFFRGQSELLGNLPVESTDQIIHVLTDKEPTTVSIDELYNQILNEYDENFCAVVGIGGGSTLDAAKAVSNLLTNGGQASDYQGWDLVKLPGIYKVGVPTISGTGAEATRTCVMTNQETGLKLGMNSDYTVFDQLILDPKLSATVPRNQYFFTGMDAWIHCIEALNGTYRNPVGDALSAQAVQLCREVFNATEMMSDTNREKLMVASYLGGCAIAMTYVGVVHPFSAGLSVVLGLHHCVANCVTIHAMEAFYPVEHREFMRMIEVQDVNIPNGVCTNLSDEQHEDLYESMIIHEKPLTNALGENFLEILSKGRVRKIFEKM